MKITLLAIIGLACLATSGIAMVAAENAATTPGPEAIRGQGGAQTDMDDVGREQPRGEMTASEQFKELDINQDFYLNAYELGAYEGPQGAVADLTDSARRERGRELLQRFDQDGDGLVGPKEFSQAR